MNRLMVNKFTQVNDPVKNFRMRRALCPPIPCVGEKLWTVNK